MMEMSNLVHEKLSDRENMDMKKKRGCRYCQICSEVIKDLEVVTRSPQCGHIFHYRCLAANMSNQYVCMTCGSDFYSQLYELAKYGIAKIGGPFDSSAEIKLL